MGTFSCVVNDHLEITYQKANYTKLKSEAFNSSQVFGTETATTNTHTPQQQHTHTPANQTKPNPNKTPHHAT